MDGAFSVPLKKPGDAMIWVCVDEWTKETFSGVFYHLYLPDVFPFLNGIDLILKIDQLFDALNHPQAYHRSRSALPGRQSSYEVAPCWIEPHRHGRAATFYIRVIYRQNASWQGTFLSVDEKGPISFSSVLELLRVFATNGSRYQNVPAAKHTCVRDAIKKLNERELQKI